MANPSTLTVQEIKDATIVIKTQEGRLFEIPKSVIAKEILNELLQNE